MANSAENNIVPFLHGNFFRNREYANRKMRGVEWWPDLRESWMARFSEPPDPGDGSDFAKDLLDSKHWANSFRENVEIHGVDYTLTKLKKLSTLGLQVILKYHTDVDIRAETHGEKLRLAEAVAALKKELVRRLLHATDNLDAADILNTWMMRRVQSSSKIFLSKNANLGRRRGQRQRLVQSQRRRSLVSRPLPRLTLTDYMLQRRHYQGHLPIRFFITIFTGTKHTYSL